MEDIQNEEMEPKTPVQHALRFGAILGVVSAIITLLLYVIDPALMISVWNLVLLIVFLGLVIYGGISYRKEIGGYLDFGPAYIHGFVTLVTMSVIGAIMGLLLYFVIDPTLPETLTEATLQQSADMAARFGAPQEAVDQLMEDQREQTAAQFTMAGQLKGFGIQIIVNAVLALITGLIVRRREKVSDVV
jgi:hypothetical protein